MTDWQPTATIDTLRLRAGILAKIRRFFEQKNVLEVETPALSAASVTDVHLHCFETVFHSPTDPNATQLYLQTSPEYAMKRLLCNGSGAIFQICKAFRNEEAGQFHNPEFTMLEWYQPGYSDVDLMDEIDALISLVLGCERAQRISYQQAFLTYLQIDPLSCTLNDLILICERLGYVEVAAGEMNPDTLLQLLFCQQIEPEIGKQTPCFVYDFPASQAALARISTDDPRVASRFELYFKGVELANGFDELSDPAEQRARFERDNQQRESLGLPTIPIDSRFIAGLENGLPDCSGVALGIDRLVMLAANLNNISDVIAFSVSRA